ncbi:MAG: nitrogen regulation protein NtrY, partial [Segetibacter sp.]|nr:nitrogen regulation protein NtrY [Segetibacter sp.]
MTFETVRKSFIRSRFYLYSSVLLYLVSILLAVNWSFFSSPDQVKQKLETFIKDGEERFETFTKDQFALRAIADANQKPVKALEYIDNTTNLYVYTRNDVGNLLLIYWNNHEVIPDTQDLQKPDGKYMVVYQNGEFELVKKTQILNGREVVIAGLIPLRVNYFFENKYLRTEFPAVPNIENRYELTYKAPTVFISNGDGKLLFGLKEKAEVRDTGPGVLAIIVRVIAVILLLIFINLIAYDLALHRGWRKGLVFLVTCIFFLRLLSYLLPFPFNLSKFELFDPLIYAYDYTINPSLGDLFINMILVYWIVNFIKTTAIHHFKNSNGFNGIKAFFTVISLSLLLLALSFTCAGVIRSLIVDSKISFDVANFFSLNIYSIIAFIVLCFIILSFFYVSHFILLFIFKQHAVPAYVKYLTITIVSLFYLTLNVRNPGVTSNLPVLLWLLAYLAIMELRQKDILTPIIRSSFFLLWLIFFAGSVSALIIFQNKAVEMEQRIRLAEKIALQTDPAAESIMSIGLSNFNTNFLAINFPRLSLELSNKNIKDSLLGVNFSGFLNKYDSRIYTYDRDRKPLFNEDPVSFDVITNIILNQSKKTSIPNVYYYEDNYEGFSYLFQKEIKDFDGNLLGYFFVFAKPKRYKSEALYPELFKQVKDITSDLDVNYAYAVYNKGELANNKGDYNFVTRIPKTQYPKRDYEIIENDNNYELWYNAGNNKLVIIARNSSTFFDAITLFAYLFGSFLFIIIVFHLAYVLLKTRFRFKSLRGAFRLNIRTQIQATIIFISVFSFFVIGIATISFYIKRFNQNNRERLIKSIQVMASEIQSQIATHSIFDDVVKVYDLGANSELERSIDEIAEIHSVDVNFYDLNGNLQVSTQPYIYNKEILSKMMEPTAFYRLHYNNDIQFIQDEMVGRFPYISIYVPIRDESGKPYAYLNIPYLNSQRELNQEISNFLVTLINLNAFIFVLAGAIAMLVTNRITNSFTLIAGKMKDINLRKANEEINWSYNDEIGALVNEYNKMVKKLEESAQALAKSEREGAWREMARQVAHEIKNPLTPMKLSI